MSLGKANCRECGQVAILSDAVKNQEGKFERVFVCPLGHRTIEESERDGQRKMFYERQVRGPDEAEKPEPSSLERLNRFLDELEGKGDA